MVIDTRAVEEVVLGPRGVIEGAKPGSVVIDHSTIDPDGARRVAAGAESARHRDARRAGFGRRRRRRGRRVVHHGRRRRGRARTRSSDPRVLRTDDRAHRPERRGTGREGLQPDLHDRQHARRGRSHADGRARRRGSHESERRTDDRLRLRAACSTCRRPR